LPETDFARLKQEKRRKVKAWRGARLQRHCSFGIFHLY
jgi:hypothetical protein